MVMKDYKDGVIDLRRLSEPKIQSRFTVLKNKVKAWRANRQSKKRQAESVATLQALRQTQAQLLCKQYSR